MASDRRIANRLVKRYEQGTGSVRTAAFGDDGDVVPNTPSGAGAAKDQLGGGGQNQFSSPGAGMRQIPKGHVYDPRALKPMAKMLWACSVSLGHALTAYREFTRFKSSAISPDGMVGGRGYVMTVKDVRTRLQEACEALSAVSDTIHDEINAPHWGPQLDGMGDSEKVDFDQYVDEAESILNDPEAYGQEESEEVEEGKSKSKSKGKAQDAEESEDEEDDSSWDDEADEAAEDTEEQQPEADGVKLSPIEEESDEESDEDSDVDEDPEEVDDDDRHTQTETGGKDRFDEGGDEEEPSWADDSEEEEPTDESAEEPADDETPDESDEESEDPVGEESTEEGEIPPADDIDDDDLFGDMVDAPAEPKAKPKKKPKPKDEDEDEDEEDEDEDEDDSSSELPNGGDPEVVAYGDENGNKKRKKSSLRYARSSVPGTGGSVPRVDTYDRGSPRGPYDSFNEDEPVPSNDWTRQINDNAYQSEWKTDFSREGESAMPSGDLVPRDAKDFGLGWGTSGKGLDHRGEPGSSAKLPADPGRSTRPDESDAMPFRQDIEKTIFANSFLPNDDEDPVARSDYYRGPKGNLANSELPNDGSVHQELDKDLMNTGYRDERLDNPYVSRNDQIERTDSIYLDSYWNRDK